MIIVSQDKKKIVENLNLGISKPGEYNRNYVIYNTEIGEELGEYKTEERAKEVLQEIINLNIKFELYKTMPAEGKGQAIMLDNFSNNNIKFDTYEMPKE